MIDLLGIQTRVLVKRPTVVDSERLGDLAGRLGAADLRSVTRRCGSCSRCKRSGLPSRSRTLPVGRLCLDVT